jgi:predicted nucleic acid-binding protein
MPDGRRKRALAAAVEEAFGTLFASRVLPFDRRAATAYGSVTTAVRRSGRTIGMADSLIAAIAISHTAEAVGTRNVSHLSGLGVPVIDPWTDA